MLVPAACYLSRWTPLLASPLTLEELPSTRLPILVICSPNPLQSSLCLWCLQACVPLSPTHTAQLEFRQLVHEHGCWLCRPTGLSCFSQPLPGCTHLPSHLKPSIVGHRIHPVNKNSVYAVFQCLSNEKHRLQFGSWMQLLTKITATTNPSARRVSVCKYDLCNLTKVKHTKANLLCENINQSCPETDFIYKVCNHSGQNKCHLLAWAPCSSSTMSLLLHFHPSLYPPGNTSWPPLLLKAPLLARKLWLIHNSQSCQASLLKLCKNFHRCN